MTVDHDRRESLAASLRTQAIHCRTLGSALYEGLLERAAEDVLAGGPAWEVLGGFEEARADSAPLGMMGGVHRLVLEGREPELARFYPSAGGPRDGDAWPAFREVLARNAEELEGLARRPIQTNEVGRSAGLVGGFLTVAAETGLPLAIAELGASAGLNLRFDRYRYESGARAFGPADAPVRFAKPFMDGLPPLDAPLSVVDRRGCDLTPVDPTTAEGRLTLMSYVWADQVERFERLRGALDVARAVPAPLERAEATEWAARLLGEPRPAVATVVFHSVVELYLAPGERARLRSILEEAGVRATPEAPVAWLRMEHPDTGDPTLVGWQRLGVPEVRLTLWPGGEERLLATTAPHGPPVRWLG